jgi:hypothetical protein
MDPAAQSLFARSTFTTKQYWNIGRADFRRTL